MTQPRSEIVVRPASEDDAELIWPIFVTVVRQGDSYAFAPETGFEEFLALWMNPPVRAYVAVIDDKVVGSYFIKPAQPGLGAHIANAGYMTDPAARGRGVGEAMGRHSLEEAARLGYRGMQFNFVVSTNQAAVRLWRKLGFTIIGTLPGAFRHATLGYVDTHVMFRTLSPYPL
ncbi:MAG: GNAT family N-acetyltransferase [Proteobacteria bacterium]|nr:GNAT family N-acetyltransferase [Pseudomonadota bacterium]